MNEILRKYFQEELSKYQFFSNSLVASNKNQSWIDVSTDESILDQGMVSRLNGRPQSVKYKKYADPWQVVFWAPKSNLAVIVSIPKKTQATTLEFNYDIFVNCINAATKSYYAKHDSLTGVLNRQGLQWEFDRVVLRGVNSDNDLDDSDFQLNDSDDITLFSFDIDKFKNINDTYGHDIGDAVLNIFASRVSQYLPELEKKHSVMCIFGRPGGEEFELIVKGRGGRSISRQVAADLIQCIREPKLPSPDEIKRYIKKNSGFPAQKELMSCNVQVTASIGISNQSIDGSSNNNEKIYTSLRREADLALYRAKNDGRNCYRFFSDIRTCHGRVCNSHNDSGLIIVDIGIDVGVEVGDIYRVFFPPFVNQDIRFEDGRTSKLVGRYPLIESARVIVLEVQDKVATCAVIENSTGASIPEGGLLQYVYTGSVPFFNERRRQLSYNILPTSDLSKYVDDLIKTNSLYCIVRISGSFKDRDTRERDAIVSEIAAAMHLVFPKGTRLFGGGGCGMYIVSRIFSEAASDLKNVKESISDSLLRLSPWLANIRAGVFSLVELDVQLEISADSAIFFTNAALTAAKMKKSDNAFVVFTEDTPTDTIYTWRRRRMIEDAFVDYQQFKSYGFDSASLDNQLGLAVLESRSSDYYKLGLVAFKNAVQGDDGASVIYRCNLALLNTVVGNYDDGREIFDSDDVGEYLDSSEKNESYLLAKGKCLIESVRSGKSNITDTLKSTLNLILEHTSSDQAFLSYEDWKEEIAKFLKDVKSEY